MAIFRYTPSKPLWRHFDKPHRHCKLRRLLYSNPRGWIDMETIAPLWLWATFGGIVLVSLFIDFVVLKKQGSHDIGVKGCSISTG